MLKLPDITLVLIETREHDLAQLALEDCESRAEFGDVLIFTDRPSQFLRASRRIVTVPNWESKIGWSKCFWYDVGHNMRTSHALCIQWDSWIVAPEMWRDEYLRYDYIGAPWWYKDGMNVGNGGFCLRSTALMRFIYSHRRELPVITDLDDDLYCRKYRPTLQDAGFEWAPESLANDFSFETQRPDPSSRHFGFHASYNFDYGCENNEERLLSRARLIAQSSYASGKCDGLFKKRPDLKESVYGH